MARWLPYLEVAGEPFDAPDLAAAKRVADRIYGHRVVRVQSEASARITEEDRAALAKRRLGVQWPDEDD